MAYSINPGNPGNPTNLPFQGQEPTTFNPNAIPLTPSPGATDTPSNGPMTPVNLTSPDSNGFSDLPDNPNILNNFDNPSYHFKLYYKQGKDTSAGGSFPIIAETGGSILNITEVKIDAAVGPNPSTGHSDEVLFTIKLLDPYGLTLLDTMYQQAQSVGSQVIGDVLGLDLYFSGYDPTSGAPVDVINNKVFSWALFLTTCETHLSEIGSLHTLVLTDSGTKGMQDAYAVTPETMNIPAQTAGEFFNTFIATLNNNDKVKNGGEQMIFYSIEDRPYRKATQGVSSPFQHTLDKGKPQYDSRNSDGVQINRGNGLEIIMNAVFASSSTAVKMATGANSADPPENISSSEPNNTVHFIETQTTRGDFSPKFGRYKLNIKYIIHPYETLGVIANLDTLNKVNSNDQGLNQQKIQYGIQNKMISKIYDYIFTGLNTEIEKVDLDFNFTYFLNIPMNFGTNTTGIINQGKGSKDNTIGDSTRVNTLQQVQQTTVTGTNGNLNVIPAGSPGKETNANTSIMLAGPNDRSKSIYSYILAQTNESLSNGGNLIYLEMYIKGDPYWLGTPSLMRQSLSPGQDSVNSDDSVNQFTGDNIFIFRFKLPQGYDEETGTVQLTSEDIFSGYFKAIQIEHHFANGVFKQKISSSRVNGMGLESGTPNNSASSSTQSDRLGFGPPGGN